VLSSSYLLNIFVRKLSSVSNKGHGGSN